MIIPKIEEINKYHLAFEPNYKIVVVVNPLSDGLGIQNLYVTDAPIDLIKEKFNEALNDDNYMGYVTPYEYIENIIPESGHYMKSIGYMPVVLGW